MKTLTSIKQNTIKAIFALLVMTQLVGCYSTDGASANGSNSAINNNAAVNTIDTDDTTTAPTTTAAGIKTLNWTAPVARNDNSPISMSEIAGYRVYVGVKAGNYTQSININDAYTFDVALNNLPVSDTYYIVMTTIDSDGRESAYSNEFVLNV